MTKRCGVALSLALTAVVPCFATETVYLKTGFSLEADSHTVRDQTLVFQIGTGTLEYPAGDVLRIEQIRGSVAARPLNTVPVEVESPEEILNGAAYLEGLDEDFVRSVAKVESGLRQSAVSPKGAVGLMQLMPSTAATLGVRADRAPENARGGTQYLRSLLLRYHGNSVLALAAYNAGPEAVRKFGGVPPYAETRRYVVLVLQEYKRQLRSKLKTAAVQTSPSTPSATN